MITVLLLMLAGMATGFLLRQKPAVVKISEKLMSVTIYILLFLLGISVGLNKMIVRHLDRIGLQAILITLGAVAGSVLALWVLYRLMFKNAPANRSTNEK
jgi:uncharacterized membrane protein YbjE (DUF340 family)